MTDTGLDPMSGQEAQSMSGRPKGGPTWARRLGFDRFTGIYIWAIIIALFSIWTPETFLTKATLSGIISAQAITAILALGVLIALAAGQYDLSAAQAMGFGAVLCTWLLTKHAPIIIAILITLACCGAVGVSNALLITKVGINSFIATLGSSSILLAITELISNDQYLGPVPTTFQALAVTQRWSIPILLPYLIVLGTVIWAVLEHTPIGRRTYATGASIETARLVGVPTGRYVAISLVATSLCAGVAGILLAAQIGTVSSLIGPSYLLPVFAACFLGTTQFKPGRFNVGGTLLALFLLATGVKGLQLVGGQQWLTDAFNGVALLVAVGIAVVSERRRSDA
jgi:ribose transport system permease protein